MLWCWSLITFHLHRLHLHSWSTWSNFYGSGWKSRCKESRLQTINGNVQCVQEDVSLQSYAYLVKTCGRIACLLLQVSKCHALWMAAKGSSKLFSSLILHVYVLKIKFACHILFNCLAPRIHGMTIGNGVHCNVKLLASWSCCIHVLSDLKSCFTDWVLWNIMEKRHSELVWWDAWGQLMLSLYVFWYCVLTHLDGYHCENI